MSLATNNIIGQQELVNEVSKIFNIFKTSRSLIRPHFILTGPSGSGKTHTIKTIAELHNFNFIEINAAQLTKEGTSGNSLSKALSPLIDVNGQPCICFVDEFDKLFISGNSNDSCAHETTTGVQNEFLKILESDNCSVYGDYGKYLSVSVSNTLFIFAGTFNGEKDMSLPRLKELGIKTEFLGRVSLVYNTRELTLEDLNQIIDGSELLTNYSKLFKADRSKCSDEIKSFLAETYRENTLGARYISTLIHQYFIKGSLNKQSIQEVEFEEHLSMD